MEPPFWQQWQQVSFHKQTRVYLVKTCHIRFPEISQYPGRWTPLLHSQPLVAAYQVPQSFVPQDPRLPGCCSGLFTSTVNRLMAKLEELDLTGAKQNTRVWLIKFP